MRSAPLVAAMFLAAWLPAAAAPTLVLHDPPGARVVGKPIELVVRVEGVPPGEPSVVAHHRTPGEARYTPVPMESAGDGTYRCAIPAEATRSTELKYYVAIHGPDGAYQTGIGSAAHPLSVILVAPVAAPKPVGPLQAGLAVLAVVALGGGLLLGGRRGKPDAPRQERPPAGAPAARRVRRSKMARRGREGAGAAARRELLKTLREIRLLASDEDATGAAEKPAGDRAERTADEIRVELASTARWIRSLCAAAWVLTRRHQEGSARNEFFDPFEDGRASLHRVHEHLEQDRTDQAAILLDSLIRHTKRLETVVARVDSTTSAGELERELDEIAGLTAETLGSVLEYYARVREASPVSRTKLTIVGLALLRHDDVDDVDPRTIRDALRRRGVLQDRTEAVPDRLAEKGEEMRLALAAVRDPAAEDQQLLQQHGEEFLVELGEHLRGAPGLAEALSVAVALRRLSLLREREQAGSCERIVQDLRRVVGATRPDGEPATETDDPAALALLEEVEAELQELVRRQDVDDPALAPLEREAWTAADDSERSRLIQRCVVYRYAVNRLAERHAQSQQSEGVAAPPLPESLGSTLLRRAGRLAGDLQDEIQRDLMGGNHARARETTRFLHQFSRTRLGLALMAKLPITGLRE